jgi:hypothetical protein
MFSFRKEQASRSKKLNRTNQDAIRQDKSPHTKAGHGNLRKEFQEQAKESGTDLLLQLGVPQNHQANNHNSYTEDMVERHAGPVLAVSVSVSSGGLYLVNSVILVLLEFSIPSDTYSLSSVSSLWLPKHQEGPDEDRQCRSLHHTLLEKASLMMPELNHSMSIAEYHWDLFS